MVTTPGQTSGSITFQSMVILPAPSMRGFLDLARHRVEGVAHHEIENGSCSVHYATRPVSVCVQACLVSTRKIGVRIDWNGIAIVDRMRTKNRSLNGTETASRSRQHADGD